MQDAVITAHAIQNALTVVRATITVLIGKSFILHKLNYYLISTNKIYKSNLAVRVLARFGFTSSLLIRNAV